VDPLDRETSAGVIAADVGRRIKAARERTKVTQDQLAKAISVHVNTIGKVERGATSPDAKMLLDIAPRIGVRADWLLVGDGALLGAIECKQAPADDLDLVVLDSLANPDQVEPVPVELAFSRAWMSRRRLQPSTLVSCPARGDSMEPTVYDGDTLVVDRAITKLVGDGLYLIERDGERYCKRLQLRFDGGLNIMSDNSRYEAQQLSADVASQLLVIGRVIWVGGLR